MIHATTIQLKKCTRALVSCVTIACLWSTEATAFSFQPPADHTGAPPGRMTCAECHLSNGSGSLQVVFNNNTLNYIPGQTYPIQVILQDSGQERFGFSMTAREEASPSSAIGMWTAGQNSGVYDGGRHIGHREAPFVDDGHTFEIMWTAPEEDVGPITFYAAGNAANGNFANGVGDNIYTTSLTIQPGQEMVSFWADSVPVDGWRNTGEAYPDLAGIGWIHDATWPWFFTYAHPDSAGGEWIYVFSGIGDRTGFWGFNYTGGYLFWSAPDIGWYYSFKPGEEGWFAYEL